MKSQGLGEASNLLNAQGGAGGNYGRGLTKYAEDYASTGYQQAYNNYNQNQTNIFNRLSNIAGLGQTSLAQTGNLAGTISGGVANTITGAGAAQAAGTVGQANAISGGLSNIGGYYGLKGLLAQNTAPATTVNPNLAAE